MERYERIKTLGRGAFGVAFLVRERETGASPGGRAGTLRVIKEVDLRALPPAARKEAQKEVGVLARFKHPHIVEYFTAFIANQALHIVMEFADGGDLAAAVRLRRDEQKPFSEEDALVILAQCLQALLHIHTKNVLHRDIKCQNIFTTKAGAVKLGDFGIARVLEHTGSAARTMIGTPNYLAPEVCENQPYDAKADIWSLGVVFYELLALQQPFQAYNMAALVIKIVTAEPPPLPTGFCKEVLDIVQQTLQKKPDKRPGAAELLNLPWVRCRVGSKFELSASGRGQRARTPSAAGGSRPAGGRGQ